MSSLSSSLCAVHLDLVQRFSTLWNRVYRPRSNTFFCVILHLNHPLKIQWIICSTEPDFIKEIIFKFLNWKDCNKYPFLTRCINNLVVFMFPHKFIFSQKFLAPCLFRTQLFMCLKKFISNSVSPHHKLTLQTCMQSTTTTISFSWVDTFILHYSIFDIQRQLDDLPTIIRIK